MSRRLVIEEEILAYFSAGPEESRLLLYKLVTAQMKKRKLIGRRKNPAGRTKSIISPDSQIAKTP